MTCFPQSCQKVAHWFQIETKLSKTVKWFSSSQNCFVLFTSLPFAVRWTCPIPSIVFFVLISSVKSFFLFATHRFFAYQLSLSWSSQVPRRSDPPYSSQSGNLTSPEPLIADCGSVALNTFAPRDFDTFPPLVRIWISLQKFEIPVKLFCCCCIFCNFNLAASWPCPNPSICIALYSCQNSFHIFYSLFRSKIQFFIFLAIQPALPVSRACPDPSIALSASSLHFLHWLSAL